MEQNKQVDFDIDVVIAWVDGNDISHQEKMKPYLLNDQKINNKKFRTRFDQVEEIEFSIRSIIKYAPFIRNIFIVTDQQTPNCLKQLKEEEQEGTPKIILVDHQEIFTGFESYLPTFNSVSIESMLYRIPNLAPHFVYFNDDLFLLRKTKKSDFFDNGNPVIRGKWDSYDSDKFHKLLHQKIMRFFGKKTKDQKYGFKRAQQNIARILGFKKYLRLHHTPASLRKSTLKAYFDQHPEMLINNIQHRFRYPTQFMIQSLGNHLEIMNKTYELKQDYQMAYFQSYKAPIFWIQFKLGGYKQNKNKIFLTMQSLDLCTKHKLKFILDWLKKHFVDITEIK